MSLKWFFSPVSFTMVEENFPIESLIYAHKWLFSSLNAIRKKFSEILLVELQDIRGQAGELQDITRQNDLLTANRKCGYFLYKLQGLTGSRVLSGRY